MTDVVGVYMIDIQKEEDMATLKRVCPQLFEAVQTEILVDQIGEMVGSESMMTHSSKRTSEMMYVTRPDGVTYLGVGETSFQALERLHAAVSAALGAKLSAERDGVE